MPSTPTAQPSAQSIVMRGGSYRDIAAAFGCRMSSAVRIFNAAAAQLGRDARRAAVDEVRGVQLRRVLDGTGLTLPKDAAKTDTPFDRRTLAMLPESTELVEPNPLGRKTRDRVPYAGRGREVRTWDQVFA